jgi:predicted enzyme related to lactoylglutathione lyase
MTQGTTTTTTEASSTPAQVPIEQTSTAQTSTGPTSSDPSPDASRNRSPGGLAVGMVTVDARDARTLAAWWVRQTGGRVVADHDGEFLMVATAAPGPTLGFQRVDDPTPGKNRVHLDLVADDREAEVERLRAEGAGFVARHEVSGFTWVVLTDPEGNQFCVSGTH